MSVIYGPELAQTRSTAVMNTPSTHCRNIPQSVSVQSELSQVPGVFQHLGGNRIERVVRQQQDLESGREEATSGGSHGLQSVAAQVQSLQLWAAFGKELTRE